MKLYTSSLMLIRFTFITLAVLTALVISLPSDAQSSCATAETAAKKFRELSDQFMKESMARSPSNASQAGYHTHIDAKTGKAVDLDALLDDMSIESKEEQRQFDERWRERFHKETPLSSLNAQDAADWQLIDDQIGLDLLDLDKIQNYKHNPTVVVELIGTAIFQPLTETYATREVRARDVLSRIRQVPRLLDQVKAYLVDCDPSFIKTAVDENAGNVDLIENTVGKEISALPKLKGEYDQVAPPAISALKSFSQWMQDDLGKRPCSRSWRLGKELYDQKFRLVMETDVTPEQLLAGAERDLKAVRAEMLQLALPLHKQMYPDHNEHTDLSDHERENLIISEVLNKISENHPSRENLQKAVEADLDGIKKFIRDNKIVSLSARENLKVIPTPSFMRGIYSVAGFHGAPPLEPQAEAEYWVTPIDPKTSDDKAESKLREYNNYTLKWLTIHEALPGHYIQFEHLNNIEPKERRLLRSLYANGAYVEGWAEYIAQVMMDEGYMKDDPRFRMIMRKIRLRLLANTILDVRLQTMGMTDEQAIDLMTKETFQTQAEADGKLVRAKLSSTQLPTYYAGLTEWLALRKRYQAEKGKEFDLLQFHDRALDQGPLPVPIVEKLLL